MNQHATELTNRGKISAKNLEKEVVNVILYAQYNEHDVLKEYHAQYWVEGRSLTASRTSETLEELAGIIVYDVVWGQKIIRPWYDIQLIEGPLPKSKAPPGFVRYTAKPQESIRTGMIGLLKDKKEELAEQGWESYLKQKQTHRVIILK